MFGKNDLNLHLSIDFTTMISNPICHKCKHYCLNHGNGMGVGCRAFPNGILHKAKIEHISIIEGQEGDYIFEPIVYDELPPFTKYLCDKQIENFAKEHEMDTIQYLKTNDDWFYYRITSSICKGRKTGMYNVAKINYATLEIVAVLDLKELMWAKSK